MIGLIGCSAQKLDGPAPARELYRSVLFRKSLAYAEPRCTSTYVLSALHGLVALDTTIAPYEHQLGGTLERGAWAERVAATLLARHGRKIDYLVLAGANYAAPLVTSLRKVGADPVRISQPLAGMQIGQRLRWLNEQAARTEAA